MKTWNRGGIFSLAAAAGLSLLMLGCDNGQGLYFFNNNNGGGGGGGTVEDAIAVQVTGAPTTFTTGLGGSCNGLYAVTYSDFDTRAGENQVALVSDGNGNFSGELPVSSGATNVTVFIYCDDATGAQSYDNQFFGGNTAVPFTNTATFNACDRDTASPSLSYTTADQASGTYTYYHNQYSSTFTDFTSNQPSTWDRPYFKTGNNGAAGAGDSFAVRVADEGDSLSLAYTDIVPLSGTAHPDAGGTLQEWCNCILGDAHNFGSYSVGTYFNQSTTYITTYVAYTGTIFGYTGTRTTYRRYFDFLNYFSNVGFFTDTDRTSDSNSGSCILP